MSSRLIDGNCGFMGTGVDITDKAPGRESPENTRRLLHRAPCMPQITLLHVVAVALGGLLFLAAPIRLPGLDSLKP